MKLSNFGRKIDDMDTLYNGQYIFCVDGKGRIDTKRLYRAEIGEHGKVKVLVNGHQIVPDKDSRWAYISNMKLENLYVKKGDVLTQCSIVKDIIHIGKDVTVKEVTNLEVLLSAGFDDHGTWHNIQSTPFFFIPVYSAAEGEVFVSASKTTALQDMSDEDYLAHVEETRQHVEQIRAETQRRIGVNDDKRRDMLNLTEKLMEVTGALLNIK